MSTDHGAAGFCTDHGQAPDERVETVARVLREHCLEDNDGSEWRIVTNTDGSQDITMRCGCDEWMVSEDHPQHQAAAVVAALGDETARLRAEVERQRRMRKGQVRDLAREVLLRQSVSDAGWDRAEKAEADLAADRAALDRVRALPTWDTSSGGTKVVWASDIRVALDPEEPR